MRLIAFLLFSLLLKAQVSFSQPGLSRGLVAYYPLNGNALDFSGNNLHGVLRNGVSGANDRFNVPNSAMIFDGIDDYIEIDDHPLLRFRDSFSICFFFNRTANSTTAEIIEKRDWNDGSKSSFDIGLVNPGQVRTAVKTGANCSDPLNGWIYPTLTDFIQPDTWYCMAITYETGIVKSYLNGSLVGTSTAAIKTIDSCPGSSVRIGIHWKGDPLPFQGKIDEVRLYNRALDGLEVESLCQTTTPTVCSGTLGAPVVNIDFGHSPNVVSGIESINPGASTSLSFIAVSGNPALPTPLDGQYTITNNTPYNDAWFSGYSDHTPGDQNGNMAFFNSSEAPGEFYRQPVAGLCENTTYEFAAWIANVLNPAIMTGVLPDITFRIETSSGSVLASYNTGGVEQSSDFKWSQYGFLFTVPTGVSSVVLKIINNNVGGTAQPGNDLAIDDITFRPCGARLLASFDNSSSVVSASQCSNTQINLYATSDALPGNSVYKWQVKSSVNEVWSDVENSNTLLLNWPVPSAFTDITYWFRILSGNTNSINSPSCRIQSDSIELKAFAIPNGILSGQVNCDAVKPKLTFSSSSGLGPNFNLIIQEGTVIAAEKLVKDKMPFDADLDLEQSTLYKIQSLTDARGCVNSSPAITLQLTPKPIPSATFTPVAGCIGDSAKIIFKTSSDDPLNFTFSSGNSTYKVEGATNGNSINLPIVMSDATTITLLTLYSDNSNECARSTGFNPPAIAFPASPSPKIVFPEFEPVCEGSEVIQLNQATETSGLPGTGRYSEEGNPLVSFDPEMVEPGNHYIRYTFEANNGCSAFIENIIKVNPLPIANAGSDIIACTNVAVQLKASGGDRYIWTPSNGLNDPTIANPVATISAPVQYVVTAIDEIGCSDNDTLQIAVSSSNKSGFLMPNAFTPNADGKNDCFGVQHWGQITELRFRIFNRWGQIVFETKDPNKCWDGTVKGVTLPTETFVFSISAVTGCGLVQLKGPITVIR